MSLLASVAQGVPVPMLDNPTADFSDTPWWLSLVKALLIFVFLLVNTLLVIWFERRVIGRMQQRPGPNRAGPFGLLQTLADGVKLALKEDLTPKNADKVVFVLAPVIAGAMAFVSFAIIPLGPTVSMFGHRTPLQLTDLPVAVLLVLAVAGVGVYGIVLAGWSSGSTYPLLGGLRSTAQVISYEIAMGLSLVAVFMYSGSMSTSAIVDAQKSLWFILPAFFSFAVYVVTMVGETNRLPFDLAEGEGELTGGFHTEYSSLKFAMFFLGEYVNMFTVSALATTMFLGGWQAPPRHRGHQRRHVQPRLVGPALVRRQAVDVHVLLRLAARLAAAGPLRPVHALRLEVPHPGHPALGRRGRLHPRPPSCPSSADNTRQATVIVVGVIAVLALGVAWVWDGKRAAAMVPQERHEEIDPFAGGYPVPPLPGQRLREPSLTRPAARPGTGG